MANVPGLLSYLGFNVMGALSLLLVLFLPFGEGGGGGSLSVPVFPGISTKPNPTKFTRILVRAMIGLLKMPLEICQSGERKIRNAFPVIR